MTKQIILKEYFYAFSCFYTLLIFVLPRLINKKCDVEVPVLLEITIYIFTFSALILGGVLEFFIKICLWDTLLYILSGFVLTGIGIFLIVLLNKRRDIYKLLSPRHVTFFAFCFSMTILVFWEFFEYNEDNF